MSTNSSFAVRLGATCEVLEHYFPPSKATVPSPSEKGSGGGGEEKEDCPIHNNDSFMSTASQILPPANFALSLPFLTLPNGEPSHGSLSGSEAEDGRLSYLLKQLVKISAPIALTQMLRTSMNLVTTVAGGHYLDLVDFAALATGLSFTSLTAMNIGGGFCAVLDTLATQEHGRRKNSPEILKYFFRSLWWTFLFYIPISLLYWFSDYFLVYLIHQDLVAPTAYFLKYSFAVIVPMLLVNNLLKFSQCQHVTQLGVIASAVGFITLVPLLILFRHMGITGILISLSINRSCIVLVSLFYIIRHPDLKKTWTPDSQEGNTITHLWRLVKESVLEWKELLSFGRQSLPIMAAFLADSWVFELLSLLSSSLSPLASATWNVLMVIYTQFFSIFIGTAIACAIRVGTAVGEGKGWIARRYTIATIILNAVLCGAVVVFLWGGGVPLMLRLLQKNASVVEEGSALTFLAGLTFIGDSMFYAMQGAFRGAGLNKQLLALVFFAMWGITLPLALVLTKGSNKESGRRNEVGHSGTRQMLLALCCGVSTAFPLQLVYLFVFVDWNRFNKKTHDGN